LTLIKSVSGFRGTIGGERGENLTPPDIVAFTSAYAKWLLQSKPNSPVVVTGRDGRISGDALIKLVNATLSFCGIHVIDCDLSTTPSVEMAVLRKGADGGIICTASHNPAHWNALKFLNAKGEFISAEEGKQVVEWAEREDFEYAPVSRMGRIIPYPESIRDHIDDVLKMELVDAELVRKQKWHVAVDAINSTGAIAIPKLLEELGVRCTLLNGSDFGYFAHDAEPLPKNLTELSEIVSESDAILGVAVDPDVDRLVFISEDGTPFGEEYTLVAIADYYLRENGSRVTVSNLSSSMALTDITQKHGGTHYQSAVGERYVVDEMKKRGAAIGGEGNGGIICPDLHFGRDAVAGLALFLTFLAKSGKKPSVLRAEYPHYEMAKDKIELDRNLDTDKLLEKIATHFSENKKDSTDGLKIYLDQSWVHIRKSNTEPILRIYTEARNSEEASRLARELKDIIESLK
jgi:phosphomannomutase